MRDALAIIVLVGVMFALAASPVLSSIPRLRVNAEYKAGAVVAYSASTLHVAGREYVRQTPLTRVDGQPERHRRVLIYDRHGNFLGFSKLGIEETDRAHRHYYSRPAAR